MIDGVSYRSDALQVLCKWVEPIPVGSASLDIAVTWARP